MISLDVLKDRNAALLCSGQLVSQVCDKMMTVGLVWALLERASAPAVAWFLAVSALPHLLLALHAGRWTAAFGPLKTVVAADAARAAVFVALAALWPRVAAERQVPALFAAAFAANAAGALFNPAIMALPVSLAAPQRLQALNALVDTSFSLANVAGPACSALLYPLVGLRGLLLFNGLSYAFAAALESGVKPRASSAGSGADIEKADGIAAVLRGDRLVRFMLGGFLAMNLFFAPLLAFLPLFARSAYGGTIGTLASLESSLSGGTLLATAGLSVLAPSAGLGARLSAGMVLTAAAYLGFVLTRAPWQGCLCLGALGFFLAASNVFILTLLQTRSRPENAPVVMSLVNVISTASLPLSMGVLGLLVGRFDPRRLALFCALSLALVAARVAANPELRSA
jgi:DHA3 family macrolide efflux protein-like MFS transporter